MQRNLNGSRQEDLKEIHQMLLSKEEEDRASTCQADSVPGKKKYTSSSSNYSPFHRGVYFKGIYTKEQRKTLH
ncbi:hypothetical protein PHYBLDRAFT_157352, partial [Phycomyces blakesleeanus NRRL 1555(-)]